MKSFIIHLVVNSNNNNILCYLNEESNHIVGMAIAALVVVASAAVAYLSTDSISSLTGSLNESFNDGFINENISLKDARAAILDYSITQRKRDVSILLFVVSGCVCSVACMYVLESHTLIQGIKARKFANALKNIQTVLL